MTKGELNMQDQEFVHDAEKIVILLEKMAERGITQPVKNESKWNTTDNIVVSPEETREIGLFCLKYRKILDKFGKNPIPDYFSELGQSKEQRTTISTLGKLQYLSHNMTHDQYCIMVIGEIEIAVGDCIKNEIEYWNKNI